MSLLDLGVSVVDDMTRAFRNTDVERTILAGFEWYREIRSIA